MPEIVDVPPPVPSRIRRPLTGQELSSVERRLKLGEPDRPTLLWLEKIRRLVELNRGRFVQKCRRRGMTPPQTAELAHQAASLLTAAAAQHPAAPPDLPSLSAVLHFLDGDAAGLLRPAEVAALRRKAEIFVAELASSFRLRPPFAAAPVAKPMADASPGLYVTHSPPRWHDLLAQPAPETGAPRVVLFAPSPYSLYSLAMTAMLEARGFQVIGIILRSLWSVARVREELNFGLRRFARKLLRKLILASDENPQTHGYSMRDLCREVNVTHRSVARWAGKRRIPVHVTASFNTRQCLTALEDLHPDYGVFTGGGIIKRATIESCGKGLLSCHPGVLPQYKGMDVAHWPLLEGRPRMIGATVYAMDRGLDTGEVLGQMFIDPAQFADFGALRNYLSATKAVFLVDVLERLAAGTVAPHGQPRAGRQYFSVHPKLESLMNDALGSSSGKRPLAR